MRGAQESTALEMKMQIIMAILSLVLLIWTEPANAQKTYSASVSLHARVPAPALTDEEVKKILADASKLLQKDPGHADTDDEDVACNVTFTLKGSVGTFSAPPNPVLIEQSEIDVVHDVDAHLDADFHIKVVDQILRCRDVRNGYNGCAYPPKSRSIIVVHPKMIQDVPAPVLWAHEFGHLAGLDHRKGDRHALMRCGGVSNASVRVNRYECRCLLDWKSPQACKLSPDPICMSAAGN
jgi:hypothetical protein